MTPHVEYTVLTLPSSWAPHEPHMKWPEEIYAGRLIACVGERVKLEHLPVSAFDKKEHKEYFSQKEQAS